MKKMIAVTAVALLVLAGCATGDDSENLEPVAEPSQTTEPVEITETPIELGEPFTLDGPNFTAHVTIENVYVPEFCGEYLNELIAVEADVDVESGAGTHEVLNVGDVRERTPDGYTNQDVVVTTSCGDIADLDAKEVQGGEKFRGAIWLSEDVDRNSEILFEVPTPAQTPVTEIYVLDLSEIDLAEGPEPTQEGVAPAASPSGVQGSAPRPEPAATEPYVVECITGGTPGPALWSDGEVRSSDWCYEQLTADRGEVQCPGTDAFVDHISECTPERLGGDSDYDPQDFMPN